MMDVKHCKGCEQDFYNGNNPYGVKECWSRQDAKMGQFRLIPIDLPPPYLGVKIEQLPTCYQRKRYAKVKPDALDARGYWRSM